jgi:hypothetical protein
MKLDVVLATFGGHQHRQISRASHLVCFFTTAVSTTRKQLPIFIKYIQPPEDLAMIY